MSPVEEMLHKKQMISEALDRGMVQIRADARYPGVQVPPHLRGNRDTILNLSRRFGTDLQLRDDGLYADLSFSGQIQKIILPWQSIWLFAERDQPPILFFKDAPMDDLPETLVEERFTPKRPRLELIEGGGETTPPRTGHLRLVH
jgi:stringent starvation protein B